MIDMQDQEPTVVSGNDDGNDENGDGAIAQLGRKLTAIFTDRSYAPSYLARRCQTSMAVVKSWMSGDAVPSGGEWNCLCTVSRTFLDYSQLWGAASAQERARPPGRTTRAAAAPDPSTFVTSGTATIPSTQPERLMDHAIDRRAGVIQRVPARQAPDAPDAPDHVDAIDQRPKPPSTPSIVGACDRIPAHPAPAAIEPRTAPPAPSAPSIPSIPAIPMSPISWLQPIERQVVSVPPGFVSYACKITHGRIIHVQLPMDLSRADVERIHAFLRTQVDDPQ